MSELRKEPVLYDSGQSMPYVDSRIYSDEGIFAEEIEKIWKKIWLVTVHESELPEPLDFRTLTIAREPVVIVRGTDNKIRAFRNVCPHRGNLIVRKPAGNLSVAEPSGNANYMTCMFHAWQYDCFGRCVDIPRMKQGYQDRLRKEDISLEALPCEVKHGGFVWLSLNKNVEPLAEFTGEAFDIMKVELDTEPLDIFHYHKAIIPSNYKLWHDTNSEFYHDYMHYFNRATSMMQKGYFERQYTAFPNGHCTVGSMEVKYEAYQGAKERPLSFPGMPRNGWKMVDLFPGATYNIRGSSLRVDTTTPIGPNLVMIEFRGLGLKRDTPEERAQRIRDHNTIWGPFGRNLHEDLLGITGQGVAMRPGTEPRQVLHGRHENNSIHDEIGMRHFYAEWQRRMGRSPSDPMRELSLAAE
ncbi:MAG TPA: aromatic ring-hydroxylating dioxygenase subunit alpha [Stellaceae bacterium]|nr:aromatic ring-hydroxylating dioxygenase subunit alpha [Stellaceae bacterium]